MTKSQLIPGFFIDSLPGIPGTKCRELIRRIDISADAPDIFVWLKQLQVAPYSYDFIDNRRKRSPDYIIGNLPPLKVSSHFLLSFHILEFEENSFIVCRFCEPLNPPVSSFLKDLYLEYRIVKSGAKAVLWCKIKGYLKIGITSEGFFHIFSAMNKIMMEKQLKNIKKLSERLSLGKVGTFFCDLNSYYPKSGIHWWFFCRRHNCRGLTTYYVRN